MPVLTIVDGLQAGFKTKLATGDYLIGTGTDCMVVVADPAMCSDHFEVHVGEVTVLHARRQLVLLDGSNLAPGSRLAIAGPTTFIAGGTRFLIEPPVSTVSTTSVVSTQPRRRGRFSAILSSVSVAAAVVAGGIWLTGRGPAVVPLTHAASAALRPAALRGVDRGAAADMLQSRIASAGLPGVLVSRQPDGTLLVNGVLGVGDEPAWIGVRQWFDTNYGNEFVLVERFGTTGALPPLRIAAVWAGSHPYVVDDRGTRMHVGASAGDGWSVDGISAGHVVMRRGTQSVSLRYEP